MNVTYEIRNGYLYIRAKGEYDQDTAREIALEWTAKARNYNLDRVIYDISTVSGFDEKKQSAMTGHDAADLVAQLVPWSVRLVFLQVPGRLVKDGSDEDIVFKRGVMIKVTSNLQDALEWLGVASTNTAPSDDEQ